MTGDTWSARQAAHTARVEALIGPYLRARRQGGRDPVLDFLFTYYSSRPAQVQRWHPGFGVVLADEPPDHPASGFLATRGYCRVEVRASAATGNAQASAATGNAQASAATGVTVDAAFLRQRRPALERASALLAATAARPARLGCFGLHEWAMVYRAEETRHDLPLRLGAVGTDAVVESMPLRCTHFDAFRFFTDDAVGRNEFALTPADRLRRDQPGCLHATMDLYRTCFTVSPLLDAAVTLDAFELARDARVLDMRASPYDLRDLGYSPVSVETPAGRAEYTRAQQAIAERGAALRARILAAVEGLLARCRSGDSSGPV
ncbi:MAG: 3-methyladenine DNA glycosylase [Gordonia sp. (in: high G+C Gram-positive bacteria)]